MDKPLIAVLEELVRLAEEGQRNRESDAKNGVAGAKMAARKGAGALKAIAKMLDDKRNELGARVLVSVNGGVAEIYASRGDVQTAIMDWDNIREGDVCLLSPAMRSMLKDEDRNLLDKYNGANRRKSKS